MADRTLIYYSKRSIGNSPNEIQEQSHEPIVKRRWVNNQLHEKYTAPSENFGLMGMKVSVWQSEDCLCFEHQFP